MATSPTTRIDAPSPQEVEKQLTQTFQQRQGGQKVEPTQIRTLTNTLVERMQNLANEGVPLMDERGQTIHELTSEQTAQRIAWAVSCLLYGSKPQTF